MTKKLKNLIFKRIKENGYDIEGTTITIFDKKYYADYLNDECYEIK